MVATYGLKPSTKGRTSWGPDNSVLLKGKKKTSQTNASTLGSNFLIKKQPRNIQGRLSNLSKSLERALEAGKIHLDIDDLLAAHTDNNAVI